MRPMGGLRWVPAGSEAAEGLGKALARFFSPQECVGMDPVQDLQGGLQGDCCLPPPEWVWGKHTSRQYGALCRGV